MANKEFKSLSSIMIFTGNNSIKNAEALENRNYGYEDEFLGKLTKTTSNDSNWTNVPKEVFVETTPNWLEFNDLWKNAYSYIINKSEQKPVSSIYLNDIINFKYDWNNDLKTNVENNKTVPFDDINLALSAINNSLFNKQKYYNKKYELEYITYNGLKYNWQPIGTILKTAYDGTEHIIGNEFVAYELTGYQVQATEWNEATMSYVPKWNITKNEETGEEIKEPVMETQYSLNYLDRLTDIVSAKLENITNNYKEKYGDLTAYYLYDLNSKISFIGNTYTFGKNSLDILLNYDGEFNHWFDNKISFKLKNLPTNTDVKLARIKYLDNSWANIVKDENEKICGDDLQTSQHEFKITNNQNNELNLGIVNPQSIKQLDFQEISEYLDGEIDLLSIYQKPLDYKNSLTTSWINEFNTDNFTHLCICVDENKICSITGIKGLEYLKNLINLSIRGCSNLENSLDLTNLKKLQYLSAEGSNLSVFELNDAKDFDSAFLPKTIQSIKLSNCSNIDRLNIASIENLETLSLINSGIEKIKIEDTEIENYSLDSSHKLINNWLKYLKENDKLCCGKVNYINLENIDWKNVELDTLLMLKEIELHNFTGNVNIIKNDTISKLTRNEYRNLIDLYGEEVFSDENSKLKFNFELTENAFNIKLELVEKYIDVDEVEQIRVIGEYICNINDTISGNSFLNYIQNNLFENIIFDDFINNNRINIGLTTILDNDLEMNEKTESLDMLSVGDILLNKKNQIILVTKNIENINTKFIKIGKIENAEKFVNDILQLEKIEINLTNLEEKLS